MNPLDFVPFDLQAEHEPKPIAEIRMVPPDDLFGQGLGGPLPQRVDGGTAMESAPDASRAAFELANGMLVSAQLADVRPSHVQCLLARLSEEPRIDADEPLAAHVIDAASGLTLWTSRRSVAPHAARLWAGIRTDGAVDRASALTTPSLYGNKLRLTRFVAPVVATALPTGAPILDLMSGTGVISRALAGIRPVQPNDPNPYAALLSSTQGVEGAGLDAHAMLADLRPAFLENHAALADLAAVPLEQETGFLHGEIDDEARRRYEEFLVRPVLPTTSGGGHVARLATERYANAYFGVGQAIELDSIRHAIETALPDSSPERDLCLAALLLAAMACATGPHFAQPVRPHTVRAFRTMIERRARSASWEFDLALNRLLGRATTAMPIGPAWMLDWRRALAAFADETRGAPAGVYIDPPYSKLQYSRYYHVLNVLLAYDYPSVSGAGRYPPRAQRFSSRFEYQPGTAARELSELLSTCAGHGLATMLSYGDAGFVSAETLGRTMAASFPRTRVFSERLRHHSQGRTLKPGRGAAVEYVFVGRP